MKRRALRSLRVPSELASQVRAALKLRASRSLRVPVRGATVNSDRMSRHCSLAKPCEFAKANSVAGGTRMYRPRNNFIFGKMFSDERLCKDLLERLLGIKIDRLAMLPQIEKTVQGDPHSHGIRLDIYAEDKN